MKIAGRVHLLGDDINTDYIIASKYKSSILDMSELVQYVLEDYDPDIAQRIKPGDILAAGILSTASAVPMELEET